ncbi:hypothetical protein [Streptomyces sp. NPDC001508]|uniref:hypothetical protein n=1 Tax=Streptomyces sp. NPDC001508 TaxID=3154656 RepID=UPI00331C79A8
MIGTCKEAAAGADLFVTNDRISCGGRPTGPYGFPAAADQIQLSTYTCNYTTEENMKRLSVAQAASLMAIPLALLAIRRLFWRYTLVWNHP